MPTVKLNQKGMLPVPVIIGIVVLVVLLGGGYVFMTKSDKGAEMLAQNAPAGMVGALLNEKCPYNDPDLCKFINNWASMTTFRVKSTVQEQGQKIESLYEIQNQTKNHMMMSMGGKESHNTITIDNTIYTKDLSDNKWTKEVIKELKIDDSVKDFKPEVPDSSDPAMIDKTKYNKVGKEACGNLTCFKYEVTDESMKDEKQIIWFDDKEYKLRKMRVEGKDAAMEMEYSYDGISIQVPSPIKEGKADPAAGILQQMTPEQKKDYEDALKQSQQMKNDLPSSNSMNEEEPSGDDY